MSLSDYILLQSFIKCEVGVSVALFAGVYFTAAYVDGREETDRGSSQQAMTQVQSTQCLTLVVLGTGGLVIAFLMIVDIFPLCRF